MKGAVALRLATATVTLDMSVSNVNTGAYTTLLAKASNKKACSGIEIFNPSGSYIQIATGDAGSEVNIPYTILPGGTTSFIAFEIPGGTRISLQALDVSVATGRFVLNQFA